MSRATAGHSLSRLLHGGALSCVLTHRYLVPFNPSILTQYLLSFTTSSNLDKAHRASEPSVSAVAEHEVEPTPKDAAEMLRRWGCTDAEVSQIFRRQPYLHRMNLSTLQSKLQVLRGVGILGPDLARVIACRPRFLSRGIGQGLDRRLDFLRTLFPKDDSLLPAVVRNPSLLIYDVERQMLPCVQLYEAMGIGRHDLGRLLLSRATIFPRSTLDDEKLELIRRTQLTRDAPMYKYVVSIIAVSRLDTIRTKVANLEKFGFTADEVMGLFSRTPNILTLSVDKVQRNMTYITGIMKLPAHSVLNEPKLLYYNLEKVLKPRYLLWLKLDEMGLDPQIKGTALVAAMRMRETRFLKVFVNCHEEDVANALMEYYTSVKGLRRLAESSRYCWCMYKHELGNDSALLEVNLYEFWAKEKRLTGVRKSFARALGDEVSQVHLRQMAMVPR